MRRIVKAHGDNREVKVTAPAWLADALAALRYAPFVALAGTWAALLAFTLLRRDGVPAVTRRILLLTAGAAATARALTWSPRTFMHYDHGYGHLVEARGLVPPNDYHGAMFGVFHGSIAQTLGATSWQGAETVHVTQAVVSTAGAATLALTVYRLLPDIPAAAVAAGFLAAASPLALAFAPTESHFVLVATAQAAAVAGLAGSRRSDPWLAAVSAGFLAHLRPLQILSAGLVLLALLPRARRGPAVLLGALILWRVAQLGGLWAVEPAAGLGAAQLDNLGAALNPLEVLDGQRRWLPAEATITPWLYAPLAAVALIWGALAQRAAPWWLLAAHVLATAPYLHHARYHDLLRLQLPAAGWWAALAGVGLGVLLTACARHGRLLAAAAGTTLLLVLADAHWRARQPIEEAAWTAEYRFLHAIAPTLPATWTVAYCGAAGDRNMPFHTWINARSPATWQPIAGPTPPHVARYVGVEDRSSLTDCPEPPGGWGARAVVHTGAGTSNIRNMDDQGELGAAPIRYLLLAPLPEAPAPP
jgi:hypothetical protein